MRRLTRRRFPYRGLVPLAYAVAGPVACGVVSWLFRLVGLGRYLSTLLPDQKAIAPSFNNVLFGAGLPELAFASAVMGYWLWSVVWKTPVHPLVHERGVGGVFPALLQRAVPWAIGLTFLAQPLVVWASYQRNPPPGQPWLVRPLFGLLAAIVLPFSALWTRFVPGVLLVLALLGGAATAFAVALLWQQFPEEPVL